MCLKALVFGDIHSETEKVQELADKTSGQAFELVLITGDFTNEGTLKFAEKTISIIEKAFPKARILAIPGNQDSKEIIEFLESKGASLHKKAVEFNGFEFIGIGGGKPVNTFYRINAGELEAKKFFKENYPASGKPVIVLTHTPPSGASIGKTATGIDLGLKALRETIEEKQPLLVICGHVHEAFGEDFIGKTLCINVGPLTHGNAVILELNGFEKPKFERIKF
ncbi:MAG: metallophosphoesterase [Candidatus Diapherotrites archaeon]|nr:metallophosphoesterase [Candidatus Diapherotrites archaeon]